MDDAELLHSVTSGIRPAVDFFVSKHLAGQFNHAVALIQHLKRDTVQFVRTLLESGIRVPLFVAIPYSIEPNALAEIQALGVTVLEPELGDVANAAMNALRALSSEYESIVVQEVGGYLASNLAAGEQRGSIVCVIEETKNGLWRYAEVANSLSVPVIQVADTELKRIEAHFVGEAVCEAASSYMYKLQESIRYMRAGLIGYGDIGAGVAEAMLRRRISPLVYDSDPIKLAGALTAGCRIAGLHDVLDLSDLIVGATGKTCFSCADIRPRTKARYFASASSRDIEFPLEDMRRTFRSRIDGDNIKFEAAQGSLVILANGFPINFSVRSLPPNISDLLFLLLAAAMRQYQFMSPPVGLHRLERQFEKEAADTFLQFHPV